MRRTPRRIRALTLIETAAILTLGSGALALLLPTFKDAREAAKLQTCLSNLGQVGKAFLSYTADLKVPPIFTTSDFSLCPWNYGGWSGKNRGYWQSTFGLWNIQTNRRPLSVYMTPWQIPEQANSTTPTQEMPLFRCPSDIISAQWLWSSEDYEDVECQGVLSAYNDVGTSYQANWSWFSQLDAKYPSKTWTELGRLGQEIYLKYIDKEAARFVLLMEDPADHGFNINMPSNTTPGVQTHGWHGEFSEHSAAFADGSVRNQFMDTRHLHESEPFPVRHGTFTNPGNWSTGDWTLSHASGSRHQ